MTYAQYRSLIDTLIAQEKTTGSNHSEAMLEYTRLNIARMNRLDKTTRLLEEETEKLNRLERPVNWLVLTEAWCGDAAQVIPVLNKMAEQNDAISLRLILRDEHPEVMDAFLTNGGRSIPKLIFLEAEKDERVLGSWGPRPERVQQMMTDSRDRLAAIINPEEKKAAYQELVQKAQLWYAKDKTKSIQKEVNESFWEALSTISV